MELHTYPLNDLKPHDTESRYCSCRPKITEYANGVHILHNSFDGREILERAIFYAFTQGLN
jgi:hypothetical protein